jgi:ankyrin repeat protein
MDETIAPPQPPGELLRISIVSKTGSVSRVGDRYRHQIRLEGSNESSAVLGWSGLTINIPTIHSQDQYLGTEIQTSSVGCDPPSRYGPGDMIWGFLDNGSFDRKSATCLLIEAVREHWPPREQISLEAVLFTASSNLDVHVRVWSTNPDTGDGFGDPDWKAATQRDQQGIPVYVIPIKYDRGLSERFRNFPKRLLRSIASTRAHPRVAERQPARPEPSSGSSSQKAPQPVAPNHILQPVNQAASDWARNTPLHLAVERMDGSTVVHLLKNGADINARNTSGETPLHIAVKKPGFRTYSEYQSLHGNMVALLLRNGANVNAINERGQTPLHVLRSQSDYPGVQHPSTSIVANLLRRHGGYDFSLDFAEIVKKGGVNVIKKLIRSNSTFLNVTDKDGNTILHVAAANGHRNVVKLLLESGADVNQKISLELPLPPYTVVSSRANWTPLHTAVYNNHRDIVTLLLAKGAEIDAKTSLDESALLLAACQANDDIVKILLANGAAVDARERGGCSPLIEASDRGHLGIVKSLLDSGAAVDARDNDGNNFPLIRAAGHGHIDVVRMLLERGADVNATQNAGKVHILGAIAL